MRCRYFKRLWAVPIVAIVMTIDSKLYGRLDADRGYRYAAFDAGMLGGRLYLQTAGLVWVAAALGLSLITK